MESIASTSSTSNPYHHRRLSRIADRIHRATLHGHLRLLHRAEPNTFFILGATANVYVVTLTTTPSCTCPDPTTPCKHILFVLLRVLSLPLHDRRLLRRTLLPCHLMALLDTPTSPASLAGPIVRRRFYEVYNKNNFDPGKQGAGVSMRRPEVELEEGTACPVCLEEMEKGERLVACGTCRNLVHEECFERWRRSLRRGRAAAASCVICRARWRERRSEVRDRYLNLGAYVGAEDSGGAAEDVGQASQCGG